jgi:hypothetical protein
VASVTNTDTDTSGSDTASYTFTCTIGAGDGSRTLFFFFSARTNATTTLAISSATVDTIGATIVGQVVQADGANSDVIGLIKIQASSLGSPTATSVSVVVNLSASALRASCVTYVTADPILQTTFGPVVTANNNPGGGSTATLNLPINVQRNGFVIGGVMIGDTASAGTWTWTNLTLDSEGGVENISFSCGSLSNGAAQNQRAVQANLTGGNTVFSAVGIAACYATAQTSGLANMGAG